jgi:phosphoglycolate phosphatase-like HAD superfamily hydrolase
MALQVIILDFDGVVIESNDVKTEAFHHVFARFSEHTVTMMAFHHEHVSLSRFAKFEHLLGLMGRSGDTVLMADITEDFSRRVFDGIMGVPLVPGAEEFLSKATPMLPVYLASVTPAEELNLILAQRGLAHWFRDIYGCPPWTKPDAIRDILVREKVEPDDVLLIGDSAGDQRAARLTGVDFLARDSGLSFDIPEPLTFSDMNEITQHLEKLLS